MAEPEEFEVGSRVGIRTTANMELDPTVFGTVQGVVEDEDGDRKVRVLLDADEALPPDEDRIPYRDVFADQVVAL